ncbi:MAG: helix-turn-helix domain-containing protein [Cellvibrionaceae bacterium]
MQSKTLLLTTKQAANQLGVSAAFLERDRWAGAKVPFVRVGTRSIRYRQEDLDAFIASRVSSSTSEYPMRAQA